MKTEKKAPMTLLVQIEPFGEFNVKARGEVMIKAMDEGYNWIDASGSRCLFEDGDVDRLQEIATEIATTHKKVASVRRIEDPGLGLVLPEDFNEE